MNSKDAEELRAWHAAGRQRAIDDVNNKKLDTEISPRLRAIKLRTLRGLEKELRVIAKQFTDCRADGWLGAASHCGGRADRVEAEIERLAQ